MLTVVLSVLLTISVGLNLVNWLFWYTLRTRVAGHPELAVQEFLGQTEHLRGKVIVIDQFGKVKILLPHQIDWMKRQQESA